MNSVFLSPNTNRKSTRVGSKSRQPVRSVEDTVPECTQMMLVNTKLMDFQVASNVKLCRNRFCRYTGSGSKANGKQESAAQCGDTENSVVFNGFFN